MEFAQILKEIRSKRQEHLAREIQVSFATVNQWEIGKQTKQISKRSSLLFCKKKGLKKDLFKQILAF